MYKQANADKENTIQDRFIQTQTDIESRHEIKNMLKITRHEAAAAVSHVQVTDY